MAKFVAESLCGHGRLGTRKGQSRAVQVFEFVGWFPPAQQTPATKVGRSLAVFLEQQNHETSIADGPTVFLAIFCQFLLA